MAAEEDEVEEGEEEREGKRGKDESKNDTRWYAVGTVIIIRLDLESPSRLGRTPTSSTADDAQSCLAS
jgi:hypothetical protein